MIFTLQQVREVAKTIAPAFQFEPSLISAMARVECVPARNQKDALDASIPRMEQGFYSRYVERQMDLPSTVETQFATSWGVWQLMGLSLYDLKFFSWWIENHADKWMNENVYKSNPTNAYAVTAALNWFAVDLNVQCEYACKHLDQKRALAKTKSEFKGESDKTRMMLLYWNGGNDPEYDDKVLAKQKLEVSLY